MDLDCVRAIRFAGLTVALIIGEWPVFATHPWISAEFAFPLEAIA
jgi:hypothetical protein